MIIPILIASALESLVSFSASLAVIMNERFVRRFVHWFISFAVGALLGVVFFDVLPESLELIDTRSSLSWVLGGFLLFFVLEKLIFWYHAHEHEETDDHVDAAPYLVIFGDAIHNFIDGVAIALSFQASIELGTLATLAILAHEIPQEVSDYVILLHGGFSKKKALIANVGVSVTTLMGALLGMKLASFDGVLGYLLAVVAGNFLYLAASDLIPELHHRHKSSAIVQVALVFLGVYVMYILGTYMPA
ncbi:MAG: ZIP family metal transporter [Patescibacteria group bacterium]